MFTDVMLGAIMKASDNLGSSTHPGLLFKAVLFISVLLSFQANALELMSTRNTEVALPVVANGDSSTPWISPDGRYIIFSSGACNLVTNDNARFSTDAFLLDRVANTTVLVSENKSRTGGGDGHSFGVCVSTNGRYVLLESEALDLVANDTNQLTDIFVRDVQTGTTLLISAAPNGAAGNDRSLDPVMTPDGRYVAFISYATNLVANDTNGGPDVFIRDLQTQTTMLVSVGATNASATISPPIITPDGRWVAFFSSARGMVAGVSNISRGEIYLRDVVNNTTYWPSSNAIALVRSVMQFNSVPVPMHPVLSDDGRYVTFACGWTNNATVPPSGTTPAIVILQNDLVSATTVIIHTNAYPPDLQGNNVYGPEATADGRFVVFASRVTNGVSTFCALRAWDRVSGTTTGISVRPDGVLGTNSTSIAPILSADGRYVSFISDATNLVANVVSKDRHLYRRDLIAGTTQLIDAPSDGGDSMTEVEFERTGMSADGRWIVYSAPDGDLIETDDNNALDVFLHDALSGTNELLSRRDLAAPSAAGNSMSLPGIISLSATGNRAAYASRASNLVLNDTNNCMDIFVWDRGAQSNLLVSVGMDGGLARGGDSFQPEISADGRYVLFCSTATNLVANDTNQQFDIFQRDLQSQQTTRLSVTTNGVSLASYESPTVCITPDARWVAFVARTNTTGATYLLFWRDLVSGATRLVASATTNLRNLSLSTNGQRLAYFNSAGNLVVWDAGTGTSVYSTPTIASSAMLAPSGNRVLYHASGQMICYDLNSQTTLGSWPTLVGLKNPSVWSPDERYIVLVTASPLVTSDTNAVKDVYLCDLQTGTRNLISATATGVASGNGVSDAPMFSADGRFIAFRSQATDLMPIPMAAPGLYVFDRSTGTKKLFVAKSSMPGLGWFSLPVINANGDTIAFQTLDTGLVANDLNQAVDAYVGGVNILALTDSDADGVPDWWLQQYFGHPNGQVNDQSQAGDDADGDGLNNLQEFLTGTNPTDAASVLEIQIMLTPPTGSNAVLSWPAQSGKSYRVQFCDDVANGNWQNLTTPVQVSGGKGTVTVSRTNLSRIFRVRWEP